MNVQRLALIAICTAIVAVFVAVIPIPILSTGGYTHPGAIAEVFISFAFGPIVGGIAAGLGAAIADVSLGYVSYAPVTLIAHGLFGTIVGVFGWKKPTSSKLLGCLLGGIALILVYFLASAFYFGSGVSVAASEIPFNIFQVGLSLIGLLLFTLVKRAYPQIENLGSEPDVRTRNA